MHPQLEKLVRLLPCTSAEKWTKATKDSFACLATVKDIGIVIDELEKKTPIFLGCHGVEFMLLDRDRARRVNIFTPGVLIATKLGTAFVNKAYFKGP
jgi:hypothetical protein